MFDYFLNRWIISRRFKRTNTGYIYRRRPDLPGFVVTENERRNVLKEFRQRYWKSWLFIVIVLVTAIVAIGIAAVAYDLSDQALQAASYMLVGSLLVFIIWQQRKWSLMPDRQFSGCPRIVPEVPSGGWRDRFHRMMLQRSWLSHFSMIIIYGAIALLLSTDLSEASIGRWLFMVAFLTPATLSVYGIFYKALARKS